MQSGTCVIDLLLIFVIAAHNMLCIHFVGQITTICGIPMNNACLKNIRITLLYLLLSVFLVFITVGVSLLFLCNLPVCSLMWRK